MRVAGKFSVICVAVLVLQTGSVARAATVFADSEPRGADVYVDNNEKASGKTPCLLNLSTGEHALKFTKEGYYDQPAKVVVKTGNPTVQVTLVKRRTRVTVETTPSGAIIYIDGKKAGKSPLRGYELEAGTHDLRAVRAGRAPYETKVEVADGGHETVKMTLEEGESPAEELEEEEAGETVEEKETEEPEKKEEKEEEEEDIPKLIDVDCWICEGSGRLKLMGCIACHGTCFVGVTPCNACGAKGKVELKCDKCGGKGFFEFRGERKECPACQGTGYPPCPGCNATGKVKAPNPEAFKGPTMHCPQCNGTGRETNLTCRICGGTGTRRISTTRYFAIVDCYHCRGRKTAPPQCTRCQGGGVIGSEQHPQVCPKCFGTGQEYVPCKLCKGRRWIPAAR